MRWPHPERGMVSPGEFIPVAEETGLINALGGSMLRRACVDAARWPDDVRVAVNLPPAQFRVGNLLSIVMDALKHAGLPAKRLELETATRGQGFLFSRARPNAEIVELLNAQCGTDAVEREARVA